MTATQSSGRCSTERRTAMTKMELALKTIEWKMQSELEAMQSARKSIAREMDASDYNFAEWVPHYAEKFQEAFRKYKDLEEQKKMLEDLMSNEED